MRAKIAAGADIRVLYPSWVVGPDDPKCTPPHKLILDYVRKGQAFAFEGGSFHRARPRRGRRARRRV